MTLPRIFLGVLLRAAEQYLQSPLQIEHACDMLLSSELFTFHSERMCERMVDDAQNVSNSLGIPYLSSFHPLRFPSLFSHMPLLAEHRPAL